MKYILNFTIILSMSLLFASCGNDKDELNQPVPIAGVTTEVFEESISLSWEMPSGEIKKYVIIYNPGDGLIDISDPAITKYTIEKLKSGTNYEINLYWVNGDNVRSLANTVNVTTLQKEGVIEHIYEGDLLLPDQAAINGLLLKYTSVTGKLRIGNGTSGSDITDVSILSNITEVGKNLEIDGNDLLENLDFLQNLKKIGSNFWLRNNKMLTSITGLKNLREIKTNLYVMGNPSLTNLDGLEGLTTIQLINIGKRDGNKTDTGNDVLKDLSALKPILTSLPTVKYHCEGNAYNPSADDILNDKGADSK